MIRYILLLLILLASSAYSQKREMRGVWIATAASLDWTITVGMDASLQKKEMIDILDNVVDNNMNCVVFQIRPTSDALYRSSYEPWSHWLTGVQGKEPDYDPLQFVIDECNKRGLSVHVWVNPYRVWSSIKTINLATSPQHPYNSKRNLVIKYGSSLYLNPALKETRDYVAAIVGEVVRNYDIDAIHMDDYFYPYPIRGESFPDDKEFKASGEKNLAAWRRSNVDLIVKQVADTIKSIKPYVEFGISPFGIWRNKFRDSLGSDTRGLANYDDLHADILKWIKEGWVDYVTPQLYWQIGNKAVDYEILSKWWSENSRHIPIYVGHSIYRVDPRSSIPQWRNDWEIVRQVKMSRNDGLNGSMMYSAKYLANPDYKRIMKGNVFQHKSLIPVNDKIKAIIPSTPDMPLLMEEDGNITMQWEAGKNNRRYVIYRFKSGQDVTVDDASNILLVTGERSVKIKSGGEFIYAITSLSPTNHESDLVVFDTI